MRRREIPDIKVPCPSVRRGLTVFPQKIKNEKGACSCNKTEKKLMAVQRNSKEELYITILKGFYGQFI